MSKKINKIVSARDKILKDLKPVEIDWAEHFRLEKEREEAARAKRQLEKEAEQKRFDAIECPVCKSTKKHHHIRRDSNGIIGPGYSSWVVESYIICKGCGVHYHDKNRPDK